MNQQPIFLNASQLGKNAEGVDAERGGATVLPDNPFVGLRPFEPKEELLFFGRHEQIKELLSILNASRFVAVVGSSGCGKSSLVRAGLIPNLEAGFLAGENERWHTVPMKPGSSPLQNLAAALLTSVQEKPTSEQVEMLARDIRLRGTSAILDFLEQRAQRKETNFLLLVDQFEEIFRFASYNDENEKNESENTKAERQTKDARRVEAADFVSIMLDLPSQKSVPVYVVMTMRSDFIGECDAFYGMPEALNRSQYLVPRLTRIQRQEVIEKPIQIYGTSITARLTDRVLNDMEDERDQLPILQHALMRTWERWQIERKGPLDVLHYEEAGTIREALSRDADSALSKMSPKERTIAEQMFQALTSTDANGRRLRRPALLSEIVDITGSSREAVLDVIDRFRSENRSFLMFSEDPGTSDPLVDISHESLIRQWETLRKWVDEEDKSRELYLRLANDAERHKAKEAPLLRDPALQLALNWWAIRNPTEAWGHRYQKDFKLTREFLELSEKERADQLRKEREELEKAQRDAEQSVRRARNFAFVLGVVLIVAVALAVWAFVAGEAQGQPAPFIGLNWMILDSAAWTLVFFGLVMLSVFTQLTRHSRSKSLPVLLRALIKAAPTLLLAGLAVYLTQPLVALAFALSSIGQLLSDLEEENVLYGFQLETISFTAALVVFSIAIYQKQFPGHLLLPLSLTNYVIAVFILRWALPRVSHAQRAVKLIYFAFLILANVFASTSYPAIFLGSSLWLMSDLSTALAEKVSDDPANSLGTLGLFDVALYSFAIGFLN